MHEFKGSLSLRNEIKSIAVKATLDLNDEEINRLVEDVMMYEDFQGVLTFFVKKEMKHYADKKRKPYNENILAYDGELDSVDLSKWK